MRILSNEIVGRVGGEVKLAGWVNGRRDHGKIIFIDLRDRSGLVQLVFTPQKEALYKEADKLRPEYVIEVKGMVVKRPGGMENPDLETGGVEVAVDDFTVLVEAKTPPFPLNTDGYEINEELRLKYRYLDLRRKRLNDNLILRHKTAQFIRQYLTNSGFIEIETPYITKGTPEGAREFIIPSRLQPGEFYTLPQSPQQFKQLLMVAGIERYFQLARVFRDEDPRADRAYGEATQIDIELSFADQEEILNLTEKMIIKLINEVFPQKKILQVPFPRLSYDEVTSKYKSDKPDLRKNKNNSEELTFCFIVGFPMFEEKADGSLGAAHHPFTLPTFNKDDDPYDYNHDRASGKNMRAFLRENKNNKKELLTIKAFQYDLVCNGYEVGGGSLRTYDPTLLRLVFEALGHSKEEVADNFGHMLEAFEYGVPPHGGIAVGLDRILIPLTGEPSLREVIAFPKTGDGRDLMMGAPSEVNEKQLKELHIRIEKEKKDERR